jgi:hypothetical protein
MESSFGAGMDPIPFIFAAYALGSALILGYAGWVLLQRRRLKLLLVAVKKRPGS